MHLQIASLMTIVRHIVVPMSRDVLILSANAMFITTATATTTMVDVVQGGQRSQGKALEDTDMDVEGEVLEEEEDRDKDRYSALSLVFLNFYYTVYYDK
ncbi:unnamed protein product [Bursaphelenchus xylophilus]|uniref:(pine wood nematode) hypothetical protein n=1 Tax=Bursaphelenchus xylophilus TaxID=6326 RepID=A0A1I7RZP8_BURXY|nr:unnamed protein product [Bursaphelenchus xylophilus]CAG9111522.1 unnamed protein product [Bursaphelenchus xylophilus]